MVGLSDTHCHLNLKTAFQEDFDAVLSRAWEAGLDRILVPGIELESSRLAVQLAESDERIFAAVGVHPNDATSWDASTLHEISLLAHHPKVVAVGEIGLDYYRDHAPRELQIEILKQQLDLAASLQLPVIVHNRDSMQDLWPILAEWHQGLVQSGNPLQARPGVLHAFGEDLPTASMLVDQSFLLGIGGPLTFKNALDRQTVVSGLPLSSILLETDSPFLAPQPHRGRRNEPAYVALVAEKIASLKNLTVSQVVEITSSNANRLFEWRHHS
ncbi:hydrolase, TatD family [Longilinea arvoryzae]|uniref:Hydrolase, TatD family n=1 Tax=Longilinea arvoryzae TaxID=360412 RepID=A0A0S7BLK1_9CHLR|nr:TatD family hydrolase [Longilinea arvoryzae]GAP14645.1 hydrolase, TatD family [Longilinea arvoryzae]